MPEKVDFKKKDKHIYKPSSKKPALIDIEALNYLMIDGTGAPDGEAFQKAVKALYKIAYTIRMSHKKGLEPEDYYEFVVAPLEGIWDVVEGTEYDPSDKTNFKWTLMIRQPEFVTQTFFEKMKELAISKDDNEFLSSVRLENQKDGLSCHMTHIGPFDDEPASFEIMEKWAQENGYRRISKTHREIYLSDFNKTAPEKLKTVLRFKVEPVNK
ncbi:GyrI-like domain-containing protein [Fusibacter sp. JL216-2]|uniref:GyrI-like domain-containing protein n=1 Tax=Fusibacter sp. JL216-2 TaxID=3071453 RepID=UPI003D337350